MVPEIITLPEKKLIGIRINTSLSENKTAALWQQFMPRRKELRNCISEELYSVQVYPKGVNTETFKDDTIFEKWAAVEVTSFDHLPEGMESCLIPSGQYAVFRHKGPMLVWQTLTYIFREWLPNSTFELDHRPQFEVMGEKYSEPNDPHSEEDIYIPIC